MAKLQGIDAIAITDHDTMAGQKEAQHYGKQYGVEIVPGLELSGFDYQRKQKAHILCYYPKEAEKLEPLCKIIHKNRDKATREMIRMVAAHYPITEGMVERRAKDSTALYKQHILHALIDAGCAREFFGSLYRELFSHATGTANVEIVYPDVYDVLEAVRAARGVAVLAHPGESRQKGLLEELTKEGLIDGIELLCPKNDEKEIQRVCAIAAEHDLLFTGGTDFHGMYSNREHRVGTYTASFDWLNKIKARSEQK